MQNISNMKDLKAAIKSKECKSVLIHNNSFGDLKLQKSEVLNVIATITIDNGYMVDQHGNDFRPFILWLDDNTYNLHLN